MMIILIFFLIYPIIYFCDLLFLHIFSLDMQKSEKYY